MKKTYWYMAVTGISGAVITAAIADAMNGYSKKHDTSKTTESREVFSRNGAEHTLSGSAADTGNLQEPPRIVPTSFDEELEEYREDDTPFETRKPIRGQRRQPAEPSFIEEGAPETLRPLESSEDSSEIMQTGLIRRRSRNYNNSSTKQEPSRQAEQRKEETPANLDELAPLENTGVDEQKFDERRSTERNQERKDLDADLNVEDISSFDTTAPAAPEFQDPDFEELEREAGNRANELDIDFDSEEGASRSARSQQQNDDLQGLFDPRGDQQPTRSSTSRQADDSTRKQSDFEDFGQSKPATKSATSTQAATTKQPTPVKITNASTSRAASQEQQEPATVTTDETVTTSSASINPAVSITWLKQGSVNVGQPCECDLVVKNTSEATLENVNIDAYFPITVRLQQTEPLAQEAIDHLTWTVPQLAAGKEYKIHIKMIPNERGELPLSAQVRFTGISKSTISVEEPLLKLAVKGPKEISLGDPASQIVIVTNPGTGITRNVVLECTLSEGLAHKKGNQFKLEVGSLEAGESRQLRLPIEATLGGTQNVKIVASSAGGLSDTTEASIAVSAPSLEVALKGPSLRYLGRAATYTATVSNSGQADSSNIRVIYKVPEGFRFVSAGQGGRFNAQDGTLSWFVGQLGQEESKELTIELKAIELGQYEHEVVVLSDSGTSVNATTKTEVDGAVDLVLEVDEADDPVEVGTDLAYEIRVFNDGTKEASNVTLSCTVPIGLVFQNASGPGKFTSTLGDVRFETIPTLKPGESVIYTVIVKAKTEGQHRLRAELTSASITEPLVDEELTRFYGE